MEKYKKTVCRAISFMLAIMMIVTLVPVDGMEVQAASKKKNVVILYFSATGTTKSAASRIKKKTKGKMIEIKAADPYTSRDLDYNNDDSRVARENASASTPAKSKVRPKIANLKTIKKAVKKADIVYIGYPNWWASIPMPIASFLEEYDFSGKTIIPFCSHGGGRFGQSLTAIAKLAPDAAMGEALSIHYSGGSSMPDDVSEWLRANGIIE